MTGIKNLDFLQDKALLMKVWRQVWKDTNHSFVCGEFCFVKLKWVINSSHIFSYILWKFYLINFGNFSGSTLDERLFIWLPIIFILWKFYLINFGKFSGSTLDERYCLFNCQLFSVMEILPRHSWELFSGSPPDERLFNFAATCCNFNTELYYGPIYVLILGLCHMPINFIIATTHFRTGTEREPPAARQW